MSSSLTRREFLARAGIAVAGIQTFEHLDPCCAFAADAKTADKELFELKPVADGIYAAIAAPRYKVNSNAAVIVTNDGVIVVDSHSKPSAAYALYREIQSITKQPIKKIINTHFHWDHWQGNQVYAEANPNLEIISSQRTLENMTDPDAGGGGLPYIEKQLASIPKEIEKLKDDIMRTGDAAQKTRLEANLQQTEAYLEELKRMKPPLPNRTVANSVTLNEGGREIQLLLLGRGHTDGDVFIHLPEGKSGRDRRRGDRLDAVHERRLPGGMGADTGRAGQNSTLRRSSRATAKSRPRLIWRSSGAISPISSPWSSRHTPTGPAWMK